MQSNLLKKSLKLVLTFFVTSLLLQTFFLSTSSKVQAQPETVGEVIQENLDSEFAKIEEGLQNCPDSIKHDYMIYDEATQTYSGVDKQKILDSDVKLLEGRLIVGRYGGQNIVLSCPNAGSLEKLIIRLFVFLTSIVGAVFSFATGKSAILMITAFDNEESFQGAAKSLKTSILAVFGVFFAYLVIVFIMTGILGVGGSNSKYNLICQQRIVFSLTLDNPNLKCENDAVESDSATDDGEYGPYK